tara:strand:+ start:56 stop:478 length:423 start_codon:yes stop_codon:yes gene_type:complete
MIQTNRLTINAIGKIKKPWIKEGINQYKKRMPDLLIREFKDFKINYFKENRDKSVIISLCEEGKSYNSKEFSSLLLNFNNQKITFFIGDADGLSSQFKYNSDLLLSLSQFTFPHELARLILIEQIYRAVSITKNSPYHRS